MRPASHARLTRLALDAARLALCMCALPGCVFPLLNTQERHAAAGLAFTRSHASHQQGHSAQAASHDRREARDTHATPHARNHASVLGPSDDEHAYVPGPPPEPESSDCYEALAQRGIPFEAIDPEQAHGVALPMRLTGPIHGVEFVSSDHDPTHTILDCRLALSLEEWTSDLRTAGVRRVEHFSMYRPGAHVAHDGKVSGHAHGLAIDAARFTLDDGEVLDVLSDWEGREHGAAPCPMRPEEAGGSRLLRGLTCRAVDEKLFQVIITPHHDKAHQNHVHLERKPEVDWTYVR